MILTYPESALEILHNALASGELNQSQIADKLGVSKSMVNRWVHKKNIISYPNAKLVIQKLGKKYGKL